MSKEKPTPTGKWTGVHEDWCRDDRIRYEKRIEELEDNLARITEERNGYKTTVNSYEHKITDLEWQLQEIAKDNENYQKENAKLQHNVDTLQGYLDHDIEYDMDKQLVQAKEIIKDLLSVVNENGLSVIKIYATTKQVEQAEQFLKEIKGND